MAEAPGVVGGAGVVGATEVAGTVGTAGASNFFVLFALMHF